MYEVKKQTKMPAEKDAVKRLLSSDEFVYLTLNDFRNERIQCEKGLWIFEAESFGDFIAHMQVMVKKQPLKMNYNGEL